MSREEAFVLYESPHRVVALMEEIALADPARQVCLGREMTKIHEEFLSGSASEVLDILKNRGEARGEFSVLVAGLGIGVNYSCPDADTFVERQGSEMTIDRLNSIDPIRDPQKPSPGGKAEKARGGDSISISSDAAQKADLFNALEAVKAAPETRSSSNRGAQGEDQPAFLY